MKKILLIMLCMVLLVGTVSAEEIFTFDNIKQYDEETQTVTIVNTFGLGRDIATIQLKTPLINTINGIGYKKVAEFEVTSFEDYADALKKIDFYNINDDLKSIERSFDYRIKVNESYLVNDYAKEPTFKDGKYIGYEIIGSHLEYKEDWVLLENTDFKENDILTIGIFTQVNIGDYEEWIPTFYGEKIDEWASFIQSSGTKTYMEIGGLNYTIYTFNSNGYFNSTVDLNMSVLVVAGGGGGGAGSGGGGAGGAGGLVWNNSYNLAAGDYNVTVGTGGVGVSGDPSTPLNGTNSLFDNIVAQGGGGGGLTTVSPRSSSNGGNGGGTGSLTVFALYGLGTQQNNSYGFAYGGNDGGNSTTDADYGGGGGGGATADGTDGDASGGGDGGAGAGFTIYNGTILYYAGGGGGGFNEVGAGDGGLGGGGAGGGTGVGTDGTANTGGGGGAGGGGNAKGGDGADGIIIIRYLTSEGESPSPIITLNSPTNNTNSTTTNTITFNCTASDDINLVNVSLILDGTINETNSSDVVNGSFFYFTKNLAEGNTYWSCRGADNESGVTTAGEFLITIETRAPEVIILAPNTTVNFQAINLNLSVNWSANDTHLDTCILQFEGVNRTVTCSDNQTQINITNYINRSIIFYVNDTFGNINVTTRTWDYRVFEEETFYNSQSHETSEETFTINVTTTTGESTSAELFWNDVGQGTSTKTGTDTNANYSNTIQIPIGNGTKEFLWQLIVGSTKINTTTTNQTVNQTVFTYCNTSYTTPFLNVSFKDESDDSVINATIPTSNFVYYLGDGTYNKTYTYINTSLNYYYTFCATPNLTINVDPYIQYKQGADYPQRVYDAEVTEYTNTTTNLTLYLLGVSDGIYVTFQVINSATQAISGVEVTAIREISGSDVTVGVGTTGADGGVTLWLNPDFLHTFTFIKSGLTTYTTSFLPTQTAYTITMGGGETVSDSYFKGIDYSILPINISLTNDTIYAFGFNLTSSFWDLTSYGFDLRLTNGTEITGGTTTTSGTPLTLNYNTTNQTKIYLDYYWLINGTYTNRTFEWKVYSTSYTQWSISTFFTDLTIYLDSGFFGIDNFGRYLIIFILIFFTAGIVSYKFGMTSPIAVSTIIFLTIFFLETVVGVIPSYVTKGGTEIPSMLTFISGLVLTMLIFKEVRK